MNARTQISMDSEMQRRAHAKAAELGISFAEYVRRLVANDLGEPRPGYDITELFDYVKGGPVTDIARNKQQMIGDAVWEEHLRSIGRAPRRKSRSSDAA
jgi:hypothetical protein